jgi:hypothetical protein
MANDKGTGDDYHEPGLIFKGIMAALAIVGVVSLIVAFLKGTR